MALKTARNNRLVPRSERHATIWNGGGDLPTDENVKKKKSNNGGSKLRREEKLKLFLKEFL